MRPTMMKRIVLATLVGMSTVIGPSAYAVDPDMVGDQQVQAFFLQPVVECNDITGANFQPATGGGVKITSLDAGGLFSGVGFQVGDVILAVDGQPTNDAVSFCSQITSNKGNTVTLIVKDVNTGSFVVIKVQIPN
jgi:C-terminal processing protease CtpA/Prc